MVGDNFMWFVSKSGAPVSGETTDETFKKLKGFELTNFTFTMSGEEATEGKASTSSSAGKAKFGRITIDKSVDTATVSLYKACSMGTVFPTIMMGIRRVGGNQLLYLQYIFRYNQVTAVTWSGGSGVERAKESVTISFKAMAMQYIAQSADGSPISTQQWAWNTTDQGTSTLDIKGIEPAPDFLDAYGT